MVIGRPRKLTKEQRDTTNIMIRRTTLARLRAKGKSGESVNDIIEKYIL